MSHDTQAAEDARTQSLAWVCGVISSVAGALGVFTYGVYTGWWAGRLGLFQELATTVNVAAQSTLLIAGVLVLRSAHRRARVGTAALWAVAVGGCTAVLAELVPFFAGSSWQLPPELIHFAWVSYRLYITLGPSIAMSLALIVWWRQRSAAGIPAASDSAAE